jgi:tRNA (guanine37-N1)-methyltransferase
LRIDILSLFPGYFQGPFDESIIKRARQEGILDIELIDIRDFAEGKHRRVDDRPYGGGPGMVLMPGPVSRAIFHAKQHESREKPRVIYLSPQGALLTAEKCRELAKIEHLILVCGHYEGIDERVISEEIDEELSIGDYVLANGCLSAIVLVDAVARFLPGVLGHEEAANQDSFQNGIFDCPHYTRPVSYKGIFVPQVLLSGNHKAIENWRYAKALAKTQEVRPDLLLRKRDSTILE